MEITTHVEISPEKPIKKKDTFAVIGIVMNCVLVHFSFLNCLFNFFLYGYLDCPERSL